jgi:hypothetical protein
MTFKNPGQDQYILNGAQLVPIEIFWSLLWVLLALGKSNMSGLGFN